MTVHRETCLFVGRFQPPHIGHISVLAGLAATYSRLIVGISNAHISHTPNDPLTGGERYELLSAICESCGLTNVEIIPIPVDPFPTTWVPAIASISCPDSTVFTEETRCTQRYSSTGATAPSLWTVTRDQRRGLRCAV